MNEIYASSSEVASGVPEILRSMNVKVKIGHLKYGDYIIKSGSVLEESLAFERKSVADFIGSIIDGRLKTQLSELSSHFNRSYLILEGVATIALMDSDFNRKTYFSNIMSATLKRSPDGARGVISVIPTESPMDTALVLEYAQRKLNEGDLDLMPAAGIVANAPKEVSILAMFPGFGRVRAIVALEKYGTLHNVFQAAANDQLIDIKGIGVNSRESFKELLMRRSMYANES